jgi:hypothetical protein
MNGKTAGNRRRWLALALAVAAVIAVLAQCMRSHGVPNLPAPPPGGSITLPGTQNGTEGKPGDPTAKAVHACRRLAPRGREITTLQIVL